MFTLSDREELPYSIRTAAWNNKLSSEFTHATIILLPQSDILVEQGNQQKVYVVGLSFWTKLSEQEQTALVAALSFDRSFYQDARFEKFLNDIGVESADEIVKNARELQDDDHFEQIFKRFE